MAGIFKLISSPAPKAAEMLSRLAIDPEYGNANGKFFKFNSQELKSSAYSYDRQVQEKLWEISETF